MINIDEDNLKNGVLGLVLAVVEILRDALQNQATRRIESGTLTDEEVERLGAALADLDTAIEDIKREQGLQQAVQSVRDGLDDVVNDVVQLMTGSGEWRDGPVGAERQEPVGAER
jgi:replicative DNA helicase